MNNVRETTERKSFFPKSKKQAQKKKSSQVNHIVLSRNHPLKRNELEKISKNDAKVHISEAIKDFSRIKKAVDNAPPIDKSEQIALLKQKINNGTYEIDYDALADKILSSEY